MGLPENPLGIETSGGICGELTTGVGDWPAAEVVTHAISRHPQATQYMGPTEQEIRLTPLCRMCRDLNVFVNIDDLTRFQCISMLSKWRNLGSVSLGKAILEPGFHIGRDLGS